MICRECGIDKPRFAHIEPAHKRKHVYRDENGRAWNGLQCPQCKTPTVLKINTSKRLCRKCKNLLPPDLYFYHEMCKPDSDVADGYEYL